MRAVEGSQGEKPRRNDVNKTTRREGSTRPTREVLKKKNKKIKTLGDKEGGDGVDVKAGK